jgi:PAS domain S-box-containing protein
LELDSVERRWNAMSISAVQRDTWAAVVDAVVTVDETGLITSWNPAAERLLGHPAEAVMGHSLALIIPAKHRSRHYVGFHRAMASARLAQPGKPTRVLTTTADGRIMPLTMTLGLLGPISSPNGVIAVLRRTGYPAAAV